MDQLATGDGFDIRRVLMIVRRRWWLMLLCTVAVTGAAYAFTKSTQKQYTASASLLLQQTNLDQVLLSQPLSQPTVDPTREAATNVAEVSSSQVADMTAAALHIPETKIANELTVSAAGQTDVVSISATDPSPRVAANLVNTYAQQAIIFRRQADRAQVLQVQRAVQAQLDAMSPVASSGASGKYLRQRNSELQYLADAQTGNAQILNAAKPPTTPSIPKTKRNLILGLLFGLVLGIGAAVGAERISRRVRISGELADIHGLPVLVDVPSSHGLSSSSTGPPEESDREPFRMLLAKLRYSNPGTNLRSILITSAGAGEGKSTIAWHLAAAAAVGSSQRVLLIETDLRRPVLAERHGLRAEPGLADILTQQGSMDDVIQTVTVEHDGNGAGPSKTIDVLVGGAATRQASSLIDSESMTQILLGVSKVYDLIVIDSPPLLMSDAVPLLSKVSGVLIVSRVGVTTRDEAAMLRDQLRALHAPALGVVANGVKAGLGQYGYYGGRSYHWDGPSGRGPSEGIVGSLTGEYTASTNSMAPEPQPPASSRQTRPAGLGSDVGSRTGGYTASTTSMAPGSQTPASVPHTPPAGVDESDVLLLRPQLHEGGAPAAGPELPGMVAESSRAGSSAGPSPDLTPAGGAETGSDRTAGRGAQAGANAGASRRRLAAGSRRKKSR
jgi:tyrosine-protein kinase